MYILIKNAKIVSSESPFNGQVKDVFVGDGRILEIGDNIKKNNCTIVNKNDLHISVGWFDFGVNVCFPKNNLETLESVTKAAARGGFTEIGVYSSKENNISSMSDVCYFKNLNSIVNFHPIASATKNMEGKELNESLILKNNGAIAFSDNKREIRNPLITKIIFEYNQDIDSTTVVFCNNEILSHDGVVHESKNTISTGLRTIPYISEIINLERDLQIAEYSDSKVHFGCISLKKSVDIIKKAKTKGLKITSHVAAHNLVLDDTEVLDFDPNAKVLPPLRENSDVKALKKALLDGTIDFISSDHTPVDFENKNCEFDIANFGTVGLESCYGAINRELEEECDINKIIDIFAINPRKIFKLDIPKLEIGEKANLTLFNPYEEWDFLEKDICSRQKNSVFLGKKMKGMVYGIINRGQIILNS